MLLFVIDYRGMQAAVRLHLVTYQYKLLMAAYQPL